jgi:hypothetical protein
MNKLLKFFTAAILFTIFSCSTSELEVVENYTNESVEEMCSKSRTGDKGCFEFIFPITVKFADGSSKEVASYDSLRASVKAWKTANPSAKERPTIAFPYGVTTSDGTVVVIENVDQEKAQLATCKPKGKDHPGKGHGDGKPCFNLNYPFSIVVDSATVVVNTKEDLKKLLHGSGSKHKDKKLPSFVFPIKVTLKDGSVVTINSAAELQKIKETCRK